MLYIRLTLWERILILLGVLMEITLPWAIEYQHSQYLILILGWWNYIYWCSCIRRIPRKQVNHSEFIKVWTGGTRDLTIGLWLTMRWMKYHGINPGNTFFLQLVQVYINCNNWTWGSIRVFEYTSLGMIEEVLGHTANCYCIDMDPRGRLGYLVLSSWS